MTKFVFSIPHGLRFKILVNSDINTRLYWYITDKRKSRMNSD